MTVYSVTNPYPVILNQIGGGLNGGSVYIGEPNQDPETFPVTVYWDEAGAIVADQPLSVIGGYIRRNGTPAEAFGPLTYSIRVRDRFGQQVYYVPEANGLFSQLADLVPFSQSVSYDASSIGKKLQERVSVKDPPFNAKGDGVTNDYAAIVAADALASARGAALYFPAGTYIHGSTINRAGADWIGESQHTVTVKSSTRSVGSGVYLVGVANKPGVHTANITFDMSNVTGTAVAYSGLLISACPRFLVQDCSFVGIRTYCNGIGTIAASNNGQIQNCYFEDPAPDNQFNQAINISRAGGECLRVTVSRCVFNGTGLFSNSSYTKVLDCSGYGGTLFGSYCCLGPATGMVGCVVSGNNFGNSGLGPDVNSTYISGIENWAGWTLIEENYCYANGGSGIYSGGIYCIIQGNVCHNNGQSVGFGSGITIYQTASTDASPNSTKVCNNVLIDTQMTPTQKYGYDEYSTSSETFQLVQVENNHCFGNATGPYLFSSFGIGRVTKGDKFAAKVAVGAFAINDNIVTTTIMSCSGARIGHVVTLSYDQPLQGVVITGEVLADNQVTYHFDNHTGGTVNIAAGTLRAICEEVLA
jgi:hypothetical protein